MSGREGDRFWLIKVVRTTCQKAFDKRLRGARSGPWLRPTEPRAGGLHSGGAIIICNAPGDYYYASQRVSVSVRAADQYRPVGGRHEWKRNRNKNVRLYCGGALRNGARWGEFCGSIIIPLCFVFICVAHYVVLGCRCTICSRVHLSGTLDGMGVAGVFVCFRCFEGQHSKCVVW